MAEKSPVRLQGLRAPVVALAAPEKQTVININSHRELIAKAKEIARRVQAAPGFSGMFLANPVLALEAYGIHLNPEMQHHVLTTLRHPPKLRTRREELEAKLKESLGDSVKPTDPAWMAGLVFKLRKMKPRAIEGLQPAYKPALNATAIARLQAARPKAVPRYPEQRHFTTGFSLTVAPENPALRRMDLDAPLPDLAPAAKPQATLTLEQAWFYKDDPVVHDAVELGQIMRRGFPFRTPAEFREIAKGARVDAFRSFVRAVRLKAPAPK
ncbi:hypothetical protein [Rhodobacter ferrooxidans]|uniref:Uncharacterized protein n=1 Tax=Rhodobacter ferrooxidans TaxID=371731 RepID=C8RYX6_9RHOB|nr:hypothetical protein [Rhodobacter sp. SW2]EEW25933.1 hypothetical protein Rsw2DRAFT_1004 [Rhodobacter sp. SW2]